MKKMKHGQRIVLTIDSRFENVSLIGVAVKGICDYFSLSTLEAYHIELCTVEAVTNVIRHAYGSKPGNTVEVTLSFSPENLTIMLSDTGKYMDVENKGHALDFEPGKVYTVPENGMGLFLIRSLMDEVAYERADGRNIFTLRKRFVKPVETA
jgi:serine/threonine-protein kinase RsbW